MNQNEQMREALQKAEVEMRYSGWANYVHDNFGRHEAYRTAQQALAHFKETPKAEHVEADVLQKAGNVDMMREALKLIANTVEEPLWYQEIAEKALATEPDHIPDDTKMVQPAPLVRLTDEKIEEIGRKLLDRGHPWEGLQPWVYVFAKCIMDAMIKKNGGTID